MELDYGLMELALEHCHQLSNLINAVHGDDGVPREGKLADAWRHDCEERLLEFSPMIFKDLAPRGSHVVRSPMFAVDERLSRKRKAIELIHELSCLLTRDAITRKDPDHVQLQDLGVAGLFAQKSKNASTVLDYELSSLEWLLQSVRGDKEDLENYRKENGLTYFKNPDLTVEVASS
jgi:hypothetical protein